MKYYIILQPTIRSMGGEEMYTRNKVHSAQEKGYVSLVFHSGIGSRIYIEDLKAYDKYCFPEFRFDPSTITKCQVKHLISRIQSILIDCEECIIESHEILVAKWGEIIAKEINAHHFIYLLLENNVLNSDALYSFFKFKYDRHELVGIANDTIPDLFMSYDKNVSGISMVAYCSNTYENVTYNNLNLIKQADFTIGSIGRTDKSCVTSILNSIKNFIKRNEDKTFNVLYVGGSMNKSSEQLIEQCFEDLRNANIHFTGLIYPIPIELVRKMDVCVATSGSCNVSFRCGIPTISVDGHDCKAIGLYKITTEHSLFRVEGEPPIEIEDLLDDVLIKKLYNKTDDVEYAKIDFESHWQFVDSMETNMQYFDIDKIQLSMAQKIKSILLGIYYGINTDSTLYRFIGKMIGILSK